MSISVDNATLLDNNTNSNGEIVANVCLFVIGISIICLNLMVIIGFLKERKIREAPGNVFILNLAISDTLTGVFVCYVAIFNVCQYSSQHEYLFRMGFICGFLIASAFFLNYLTVDRYLKVAMHLRYTEFMTTRKHHRVCIVTWIICLILGFLPLLGWHNQLVSPSSFFETFPSSYIIFNFTVGMIPALCMVVAYSKLYLISRYHRRQITCHSQIGERRHATRKASEIMRSIFLLIGAYLVCWTPVGLYSLIGAGLGRNPTDSTLPVFTALVGIGCMNSLLNPLIHATKVSEIRTFFKKVCCVCRKKNKSMWTVSVLSNTEL